MTPPRLRPYGGTSKNRLTELINKANGTTLVEGSDFVYGPVEELVGHPRHNTRIRLISKRPDKKDVDVVYTRLGIDVLAHLPPEMLGEILIESLPLQLRQSIEQINQALGLDLVPEEVEDLIFYDKRDSYPVQIRDESVAWLVSEISVRARHASDGRLLTSVWLVTSLDGLYPPPTTRSNYTRPSPQILLDLINEQNGESVPLTAIYFSEPAFTGADEKQTQVSISAYPGSGYQGQVEVVYNRVPLSFMAVNAPDLVIETAETSMHGVIPALNAAFGLNLTPDDIEDTPIPQLEADEYTPVPVIATPRSLVFCGSQVLTFTLPLIELSDVVVVTMLDGLYPPQVLVET